LSKCNEESLLYLGKQLNNVDGNWEILPQSFYICGLHT